MDISKLLTYQMPEVQGTTLKRKYLLNIIVGICIKFVIFIHKGLGKDEVCTL